MSDDDESQPSDGLPSETIFHLRSDGPNLGGGSFVQQTAFDAYFLQATKSSKTSANVFTNLVPPLTLDEYTAAIRPIPVQYGGHTARNIVGGREFAQYLREMDSGFNLLFYGLGSKLEALHRFARDACAKHGHVVVVNAFRPDFTLKDLLATIERVPGVLEQKLRSSGVDGQAQRIRDFFSASDILPLYLIIHNIDAPAMRTVKARSCLSLVALAPRIHLAASIDHINAPLLFSTGESAARKQEGAAEGDVPVRGYAWLWHDLTTLAPYDTELMFTDRSSISGASASASIRGGGQHDAGGGAGSAATMSETAAQHVLASVTQKAKKLFVMMATKQLEAMEEAGTAAAADTQRFSIGYDVLFNLARDNFIATTDGALRSLLGEFRDHGLVLSAITSGAGGREALWIPVRKERMVKLLQLVKAD